MKLSVCCSREHRYASGFTLAEILVVIAIMAILASIFFGVHRGVTAAQARAKTKGEMAVIATALEDFKRRYGDYPWLTVEDRSDYKAVNVFLYQVLSGKTYLDHKTRAMATGQRHPLTDLGSLPLEEDTATSGYVIKDAWDNYYLYYYRKGPTDGQWQNPGYILISTGEEVPESITWEDIRETGIVPTDFFTKENNYSVIIHGYDN